MYVSIIFITPNKKTRYKKNDARHNVQFACGRQTKQKGACKTYSTQFIGLNMRRERRSCAGNMHSTQPAYLQGKETVALGIVVWRYVMFWCELSKDIILYLKKSE